MNPTSYATPTLPPLFMSIPTVPATNKHFCDTYHYEHFHYEIGPTIAPVNATTTSCLTMAPVPTSMTDKKFRQRRSRHTNALLL